MVSRFGVEVRMSKSKEKKFKDGSCEVCNESSDPQRVLAFTYILTDH